MLGSPIQWNCHGFKAFFPEMQLLTATFNPLAFCLQETHLLPKSLIFLQNYTMYSACDWDTPRPSGGSAVLVRNYIIHSHSALVSNLQAVAVRLTFHRAIICALFTYCLMCLWRCKIYTVLLVSCHPHTSLWGIWTALILLREETILMLRERHKDCIA